MHFEKLTFLASWYAHVLVRIRGLEMLVFGKPCVGTKWMVTKWKCQVQILSWLKQEYENWNSFTFDYQQHAVWDLILQQLVNKLLFT